MEKTGTKWRIGQFLLVCIVMFFCSQTSYAAETYNIYTVEDLIAINQDPAGTYYLKADIDLSETNGGGLDSGKGWTPLKTFSGKLYGNGYTIKNMTIHGKQNANYNYLGLFSEINGGTVYRLNFEAPLIDVESAGYSLSGVGIVAGKINDGQISYVTCKDPMIKARSSSVRLGGMVGEAYESILTDDHMQNAAITVIPLEYQMVLNRVNVGGIVGENNESAMAFYKLQRCSYEGSIHFEKNSDTSIHTRVAAGGIVGYDEGCSNTDQNADFSQCWTDGELVYDNIQVVSTDGGEVLMGGIAGRYAGMTNVKNCYSNMTISGGGGSRTYKGGIVGVGTAAFCYTHAYPCVAGANRTSMARCFYLIPDGSDTYNGPEPLTEAQMKMRACFTGYDFDHVWTMLPGCSYPYPQLCSNMQVDIKNVKLEQQPDKTEYYADEEIDPAGGTLRICYEDDISYVIPVTKDMISYTPGQTMVSVRYNYGSKSAGTFYTVKWKKYLQTIEATDMLRVFENGSENLEAKSTGDGTLTYSSLDTSIATVDENGTVSGISEGTTQIIIEASETEKYSAGRKQVYVTVKKRTQPEISTSQDTYVLQIFDNVSLEATGTGDGALSFVSGDPLTVSVDENGTLKAKREGEVWITITSEETDDYLAATRQIYVKVKKRKQDFGLAASMTMNAGESMQLEPIVHETTARFYSTQPKVASVSTKGEIRALKAGTTTLKIFTDETVDYDSAEYSIELTVAAVIKPEPETYQISYNLNGGKDPGNPVMYTEQSDDIVLLAPEMEGYIFTGWTGSNGTSPESDVTIRKGSSGNLYYIANWEKETEPEEPVEERYNIVYLLNGGSAEGNPDSYTASDEDIKLNPPTKEGYEFTGWTGSNGFTRQKEVTIAKGTTGDLFYMANWEEITDPGQENPANPNPGTENPDNPNPGTENPDNPDPGTENPDNPNPGTENPDNPDPGTENPDNPDPGTENPDNPDPEIENPDHPGSGEEDSEKTESDSYQIHYLLNGGSAEGNPEFYSKLSGVIVLNAPVKKGYIFTGWTGSNGTTPQKEVLIAVGTTGELFYMANWEEDRERTADESKKEDINKEKENTDTSKKPGGSGQAIAPQNSFKLPAGTSLVKLTGKNKKIVIKWKKQKKEIDGYEIEYSLNKKMKAAKSKQITKKKASSVTIKKLKAGKRYYVRIRTFKKVNGEICYSAWSKVKSVKTKK